jgi:hypothetical protein
MIIRTSFISLSDPTPGETDGACSGEKTKRGSMAESLEDRKFSKVWEFGATPAICRVATRHISCPITLGKETMVIPEEDGHNNKVSGVDRQQQPHARAVGDIDVRTVYSW